MTWAEKNPLHVAFLKQKHHAKKRSISFLMTFEEWLQIWNESAHIDQRGRGRGKYCMARIGDAGPYAIDNVKIVLCETNLKEQIPPWIGRRHSDVSRVKMSIAAMGNTKGAANKGRVYSPETIEKMRAAKLGKPSPKRGKTYKRKHQ